MSPTQTPVAPESRPWQGRRERGGQRTRTIEDAAQRRFAWERPGGGLTLGQKLDRAWEGLHADDAAECPVCQAHMTADAGLACGDCGARLS